MRQGRAQRLGSLLVRTLPRDVALPTFCSVRDLFRRLWMLRQSLGQPFAMYSNSVDARQDEANGT